MQYAVLSDIHGNLEALTAVLAELDAAGIQQIYCLGDIVGYGPNPRECLNLVMQRNMKTVLGNHDNAVLFDPTGFTAGAERSVFWTRRQLETGDAKQVSRYWEFLGELPRILHQDNLMFVHGSARNPVNEYVFPEDRFDTQKMLRIFALVPTHCFQGHTHVPGVFFEGHIFFRPEELDNQYLLHHEKSLINVGSVGQPRDGNPWASYVVVIDDLLYFRRVPYDWQATAEKILAIPELDNFFGARLGEGR